MVAQWKAFLCTLLIVQVHCIWEKDSLSVARTRLASATAGDLVLVGGGYGGSYFSTVDVYNLTSQGWDTPTTLSQAREYLAAAGSGDLILFAGGYTGAYSDVVDIYDVATGSWINASTLSIARQRLTATSHGELSFFAGGYDGAYRAEVDIYNSSSRGWETATSLSEGRYGLASASSSEGEVVLFAGGSSNSGYSDVVDVFNGKSVPFRKTKIILLGDCGSGKTHTVRELTSEEYVEEIDRYTEALEINCVNSMTWEKDDVLNDRELSLASLRGRNMAEEVRSIINEGGNEHVEENRRERRVLDIEEEDRVAQRRSFASHFRYLSKYRDEEKTSLSDSDERTIVADIYDFGGHEVYRVVSQFFMNNWAVYLIVLNLEDSLGELREQLSYYVSVVQTFAPEARICVVGTHSATRSIEKDLEEILEEVAGEADCPIFLVENGGEELVEEGEDDKERLKATVKEIIESMMQEKRPTVPLLWTRMLDRLRRKRENEGIQVLSKRELLEIELGRAFDKDDKEKSHPSIVHFPPKDIDAFIQRMKEMGMLYHFSTPIELSDFIILDPNWLVEGMKGVVSIKEAKKLKKENPMHATNPQWREFLNSGVLTSQLLELIASVYWKGKEEWKSYFMNLLQQQSLLYRIPDRGDGEEKYVVPPLLPKICNGSLPPMSDFFKVKLERCYPPLEVYKLSFGLSKRRGWTYDSRSTRYSILLRKEFEFERVTLISISCDQGSGDMKQELSISILEQHKSTLTKEIMDDLLSESATEVNLDGRKCHDRGHQLLNVL